jgi:hypothetical protein
VKSREEMAAAREVRRGLGALAEALGGVSRGAASAWAMTHPKVVFWPDSPGAQPEFCPAAVKAAMAGRTGEVQLALAESLRRG